MFVRLVSFLPSKLLSPSSIYQCLCPLEISDLLQYWRFFRSNRIHVLPLEQTIRHGTPVLVMKGTGRVADLIADLRCVYRGVNQVEPDDLNVANGPQLCDEDMDPAMLHRFVLVKRIAQEIQGGTVDGGDSQILELNDRWKKLFLDYLFKSQEELQKELDKGDHLCNIANALTYVMRNMGRLFIHDIKNVSRADGEMDGVTLMDAVAQCVYVEMRRKGHASTCLMLWRRLERTKKIGKSDKDVEESITVITKRMHEIHAMIERSFRKDELLLLIKVDSK